MTKQEVRIRFCNLSKKVGNDIFNNRIPHDCFCDDGTPLVKNFQFDEKILEFIETAVEMSMILDTAGKE